jgi:polyhydroxyalkanoate synthesis regulator phasin
LARYQEAFSDLIERSHYRVHYGVAIGELPAIGGNIVSEEQFRDLEILYKNTSADVKELRSTVDRLNKQLSPQKVTDEVAALRKELREANAKVTKLELQVDSLVHGRDRAELREALRQEIFSEIEGASGFTREMLLTKSVPQPGHLEID